MSRTYVWVLAAAGLLLVLQVLLLGTWTDGSKSGTQETGMTSDKYQMQSSIAASQQPQNVHAGLQSRAGRFTERQGAQHQAGATQLQEPACIGSAIDSNGVIAAVVILAYNRADYLQQCITSVLERHGQEPTNRQRFPLYISQDGNETDVAELARNHAPSILLMQHTGADSFPTRRKAEPIAYYRIASHYKFVIRQMFDCWQYPKLIILEDDMKLAVDFFPFFEMGAKMLDSDSSLYCVSSWNDHGQAQFVQNSSRLERSDFFPGLGWMLTNALWQSLKSKWPAAYWDDWMRLRAVRNGRQCIRPEVCRTYNFGEKGSSHGQYYAKFLKPIKLNDIMIDWQKQDLQYLEPKAYAQMIGQKLGSAKLMNTINDVKLESGTVKLMYDGREEFERLAQELGIIDDWKDGVPRASYHGIVILHMPNVEVLLVPVPVVERALKHRRAGKPDKTILDTRTPNL